MLLTVILCQKCDLWSRFGGRSEVFTEAGPRWVVSLGEGYALWRGVVGLCPACPDGGGEGRRGASAPSSLSSASPEGGYRVLPWSDLMIKVNRPWNLLLLWVGPGPSSLLHSTRPNKIVIRSDTEIFIVLLSFCVSVSVCEYCGLVASCLNHFPFHRQAAMTAQTQICFLKATAAHWCY